MKERILLMAEPTPTASQSSEKTLVEPRQASQRHSIKPQPTCESYIKRPSLSVRQ